MIDEVSVMLSSTLSATEQEGHVVALESRVNIQQRLDLRAHIRFLSTRRRLECCLRLINDYIFASSIALTSLCSSINLSITCKAAPEAMQKVAVVEDHRPFLGCDLIRTTETFELACHTVDWML